MTLPSSGQISFLDLQNEFGGSYPISSNEYYRGGSYASPTEVTSPNIPTSGQVSMSQYYGTKKWNMVYSQVGNTTQALMRGAGWAGGNVGDVSWTLNYYYGTSRDQYGNIVTSDNATNQGFWISDGSSKIAQVSTGSLLNVWFPLIPTLYGTYYNNGSYSIGGRSWYALGTAWQYGAHSNPADQNTVFCWRHPRSSWSDSMVQNFLGFNSTMLSRVKYGTKVWWEWAGTGQNSYVRYGFMIFKASQYNSYGAQYCYNNRSKHYLYHTDDPYGEWGEQGFTFTPTVSGTTVTGDTAGSYIAGYDQYGNPYYATGYSNMTYFGRGGGHYPLGQNEENSSNLASTFSQAIDLDDLVVPMVRTDGFSGYYDTGGAGALRSRFGYIGGT